MVSGVHQIQLIFENTKELWKLFDRLAVPMTGVTQWFKEIILENKYIITNNIRITCTKKAWGYDFRIMKPYKANSARHI